MANEKEKVYFKFTKDVDFYKKGHIISTISPNKLLKKWIAEKIVEKTSKPAEAKKK